MTTLTGLVDNVLNGLVHKTFPETGGGVVHVHEIWCHAPEGWKYMIEYADPEMAADHVETLNQQPYNVSRGHVYHVVPAEITISVARKAPES